MSMCVWVECFIIKTIILQKEISLVKMIKPWDIMEIHPLVKRYIHPYNHSFKSWLHSKKVSDTIFCAVLLPRNHESRPNQGYCPRTWLCPQDSPLELPGHTVQGKQRKQQRPLEIPQEHTERHMWSQYPCMKWKDLIWRPRQGWHVE